MPRRGLLAAAVVLAATACTPPVAMTPLAQPRAQTPAAHLVLTDVAADVGLDFRHGAFRWDVTADAVAMVGGGLCWIDHDGDGWLDLYVVNSHAQREAGRWLQDGGLPRSALFRNDGGTFTDVTEASGAGVAARGTGCVAADVDLDGRTDLYVTSATRAFLLRNNGDGTFTDVAEQAGVEAFGWHTGAAVGDVDGDGWPDLFAAGYVDLNVPNPEATQGFPTTYGGVRDLLYLSNGVEDRQLTFTEVGAAAGLEVAHPEHGLGAAVTDIDGDGDLDIHVANDLAPNRLYKNVTWPGGAQADPEGLGFRFEDVSARAGVADPNAGMGVAVGDYDGDGALDLFVTNSRNQLHAAFRAQPSGAVRPAFTDSRADFGDDLPGGTGWGTSWADLDLDSHLDLVIVNGHIPVTDLAADAEAVEIFLNDAAGGGPPRLRERGVEVGTAAVGPVLARGSAVADFDNDGDLDVAVVALGGDLVLLRNDVTGGNALQVVLNGFHPGARVVVELPDGRRLLREVRAGGSYLSSEDPRAHFGLGSAARVPSVTVTWPDGRRTVLRDVAANQILQVAPP